MQKRKLGFTDLEFSTIGFGSWAAGGPGWRFAWGSQDDNDTIAAVRRAVELGVNWIDTAAVYGIGHSEEVIGRALKEFKAPAYIATKCGRKEDKEGNLYGDLRPESVREECESSLRRLKVDCIDLYQIHWPDPDTQIEGAWSEIKKLIGEGKIRYAGVSNFSVAQMHRAQKIHPIASSQPPYNMLRREVESDVLPFCKANNIGVIAYSPMQHGLLTGAFSKERLAKMEAGDFRKNNPRFQEPEISVALATVEKLRPVAAKQNLTLPQLSLAWVLRRSEVTSAIVGVRRPAQIEETYIAGEVTLPQAALEQIEAILAEHQRLLAAAK